MRRAISIAVLMAAWAHGAGAQPAPASLAAESARLDSYASTPDGRLVVAALMAQQLGVHRNHLIVLRKQTGRAYSAIYVEELRSRGKAGEAILAAMRELNQQVSRQLSTPERRAAGSGSLPWRGIGFLSTTVDRNSAATFATATPEVGVEGSRGSVVAGIPLYLDSLQSRTVSGVGDLFVQGELRAQAQGFDFEPSLTVGFPTGNSRRGLGAGKVTVDGSATVARSIGGRWRPFVGAGLANYVFNNVGYQRPYISTGGAAHFSGGLAVGFARRIQCGVGAFAVRPFGEQQITSREVLPSPSPMPVSGMPPGMGQTPGGMPGMARMPGRPAEMPPPDLPPFMQASHAAVRASELRDHGVNGWASIPLHPALTLQIGVARSFDFSLTTFRAGLGFDFGRFLFPGARGSRR